MSVRPNIRQKIGASFLRFPSSFFTGIGVYIAFTRPVVPLSAVLTSPAMGGDIGAVLFGIPMNSGRAEGWESKSTTGYC